MPCDPSISLPDPPQPLQIKISLSTFMNSTFLYSHTSKTMQSCLSVPRLFHVRLFHVHTHCQKWQYFLHFRLKNILFCKSTTLSSSIPCFKNTYVNFLTWLLQITVPLLYMCVQTWLWQDCFLSLGHVVISGCVRAIVIVFFSSINILLAYMSSTW
jgi:hypothetical protein